MRVSEVCEVGDEMWSMPVEQFGEFAHIFMEDVFWRTTSKTRQLIQGLAA